MEFKLENYKKYVDNIAYSFYSTYKITCLRGVLELNDLKQEGYIIAWKVHKKLSDKITEKDLIKIIGKAVSRKIKRLIDEQMEKPFHQELHDNIIDEKKEEKVINNKKISLLLSLVKGFCNEKEFSIFKEIIFEGKTFQEVGEERKLTRQAINLTYHKILNRLPRDTKETFTRVIT